MKKSKIKSGQGSQREARYPDELVDWLSAARRTTVTKIHNTRLSPEDVTGKYAVTIMVEHAQSGAITQIEVFSSI
jgi:hypothetical protein